MQKGRFFIPATFRNSIILRPIAILQLQHKSIYLCAQEEQNERQQDKTYLAWETKC